MCVLWWDDRSHFVNLSTYRGFACRETESHLAGQGKTASLVAVWTPWPFGTYTMLGMSEPIMTAAITEGMHATGRPRFAHLAFDGLEAGKPTTAALAVCHAPDDTPPK